MSEWDDLAKRYGGSASSGGDGASWSDLAAKYRIARSAEKPQAEPVTDFSGNLSFATPWGTLDTGIPLPQVLNKGLASLGSGFADVGLGARQMMANDKPSGVSQLVTGRTEADVLRSEAAEKRARDARLNTDLTGKALNVVGKAAPLLAVPQVGGSALVTGAVSGAIGGALEPTVDGESRGWNVALGGVTGGLVPASVQAARAVLRPDAVTAALAAKARQYGIPIAPGDLTSNRLVQGVRSVLNDLPVVGMPGQALKEQQQAALNRAVGQTFGVNEAKLTPQVMDAAKQRMGAEFDRIWGNGSVQVDAQLFQQLQALRASAADLPATQASRVMQRIDDFWSRAQPSANGAPTISGETANAFQKWLRETGSSSQSALAQDATALRRAILSAFERSNPQEAAALTLNRSQYKAFKTVEPLLDKGAAGVAGRLSGDVPAALLPSAVAQSYRTLSSQTAAPALADISQVAGRFLVDRTPQMGGTPRALVQNAGIGGLLAGGAATAPLTTAAATSGGLALGAALNSPRLGRGLLVPSVVRVGSDPLQALLEAAQRSATLAAPMGLMGVLGSPALEQ